MFGISEKIYNFVLTIKNKLMRKKRETKPKKDPAYMLFLFGDFSDLENLTQELSAQFLPFVTSPYLKYTYGEFGVVFHFRSSETFTDLKEYVDMVFNDVVDQYFLIEVTKNTNVKMLDRKIKKDFLNIDGDVKKEPTKSGSIDVELKNKERREELKNFTFEFMLPLDFTNTPRVTIEPVEPTVDEILDKITEKGIESLTEKEKEILDNYGKRQNGGR